MSWVSAADQQTLVGTQQVKVHFAESCITNPSLDQISQAIAAAGGPGGSSDIGSVASVADISSDISATLLNPFSILTQFYAATINPVDGVQAGQLRADIYNALTALANASGINCNNFTVGIIEYNDGAGIIGSAVCGPGGCGTGFKFAAGSLGLVAIAVVAVVILIFVKVR